jgi:cell division protein FtsB
MKETPPPSRGPRPIAAFFLSLAGSSVVLGLLLVSDGRVLELKKAREDARELDRQVTALRQENQRLRVSIESAQRHEFPAERVAREELHLVHPEDLVLFYPSGSLSPDPKAPGAGAPESKPSAAPSNPSPSPR